MIIEDDIKNIISDQNIDWIKLKDSSVLITGASGLIGSLCVRTLLALEFPINIYVLVRNIERAKTLFGTKVQYLVGDVRNEIQCETKIDYIIHCASNTKSKEMIEAPVDTLEITIGGTQNILKLAQKNCVKSFVYISSMEAYGKTEENQNPVTEDKLGFIDLTAARSSYSEGKRAAECLCMAYYHQYSLPIKIARLALTMGPGIPLNDNRVAMQFAKSAAYGNDIILHTTGESISNFCYTVDCIRGIFTTLLKGTSGEIYNVCNDKETRSIRDIAKIVADNVARGNIKVVCDIPESNQYGYAPNVLLRLSSEKLLNLGWSPTIDLETAYRHLIQYIKE